MINKKTFMPGFRDKIFKNTGNWLPLKETTPFFNAFMEELTEHILKKEDLKLVEFGTFKIKHRAARKGINPKTKESITIPAHDAIVFKASEKLSEKINKPTGRK